MIAFSALKTITIPEGKVKSVTRNGVVIWSEVVAITLVSISASYTGGSVPVGTSLNALTGISVTATYSDGTTSAVTGYTLGGTIAEGSNTVTVSYGGQTTTFTVVGYKVALTSISATYTGGNVVAGTSLSALTGITVTGYYNNGTTANITGYTLTGEVANGDNVITVSYGGCTTTFTVTGYEETGLPSAYQEVTFLRAENNTATYIDLGFAFDTKARVLMNYHIVNNGVTSYPFGASENSGKVRCMISSPYSSKTYLYGSTGSANLSVNIANTQGVDVQWEIILQPGKLAITNVGTGATASNANQGTYKMSTNLLLFAQNYNGTVRYGGIRRIGKFQYYDKNDALICDLVPCYRKSDGVRGMYDLVRKTFLTNAGTGADFTKGADVA